MNEEELNGLKYRQLQKLAKENGVKANLPKTALIAALLESQQQSPKSQDVKKVEDPVDSNIAEQKIEEPESLPSIENGSRKNSQNRKSERGSRKNSVANTSVESVPSRRNSRKRQAENDEKENEENLRESKKSKSFDQASFEAEASTVEQFAQDILSKNPRKKSKNTNDSLSKPADVSSDEKNKSICGSRRNSRISRLFDKEAFDIEAAKVSRFAQQIVNSPRKRSSILNLTPVAKDQTTSAVNSPLVAPKASSSGFNASMHKPLVDSPLVTQKNSIGSKRTSLANKPSVSSPFVARKSLGTAKKTPNKTPKSSGTITKTPNKTPIKTPLHKRPSMIQRTAEIKKTKSVTLKTNTPGSVTKAKERTTGIPRPRKVPNFAKLHAKQFGKMDTLNSYLDKKKERMAALTPGKPKTATTASPSKKAAPITQVSKANFNFTQSAHDASKKPFVFKASRPKVGSTTPKTNKILQNITNNKATPGSAGKKAAKEDSKVGGYKPYAGKMKPWNAKDTLKSRQQMANRALGSRNVKEQQMKVIKGVRMNKRMELMMQRRNAAME